jgi:4-amino-4-deoxychorismate lyase
MRKLNDRTFPEALAAMRQPFHAGYYAMYSSLLDGIVTEPTWMLIPIDDHLVHRGDGVFESAKCVDGAIYNLGAHLARLERSALALNYNLSWSMADITRCAVETVCAGERRDCLVRIIISRGPGSLGVSPYDSPAPQLYVVAYALPTPFMQRRPEGATLISSRVPVKQPFFTGVKCCNYLPNVLMKREAVDAGADFAVAFDDAGHLAEGATENVGVVQADGALAFPRLDNILCGTTMLRVMELAQALVRGGVIPAVGWADISRADLAAAREVLIVGTTTDVTAVRSVDGRPVGDGRPGPVARQLDALLRDDIRTNASLRVDAFRET